MADRRLWLVSVGLVGVGALVLLAAPIALVEQPLLRVTWLPWTTAPDAHSLAPGPPGDLGEEIIESINEIVMGIPPWASPGQVTLRGAVINGALLGGVLLGLVGLYQVVRGTAAEPNTEAR